MKPVLRQKYNCIIEEQHTTNKTTKKERACRQSRAPSWRRGHKSLHGTAHGAPAVIEQRDPIVIVRGRCVDTTMQRLVLALLFLVHVVLVGAARGKHALLKSHLNSQKNYLKGQRQKGGRISL